MPSDGDAASHEDRRRMWSRFLEASLVAPVKRDPSDDLKARRATPEASEPVDVSIGSAFDSPQGSGRPDHQRGDSNQSRNQIKCVGVSSAQ